MQVLSLTISVLLVGAADSFLVTSSVLRRYDAATRRCARFMSTSSSWNDDDDWSRLSRVDDTQDLPAAGEDIVATAARLMEEDSQWLMESLEPPSKDDQMVSDIVETIHSTVFDSDSNSHLYDYPGEVATVTMEDEMGREISMLVRCNESPEDLLIDQGRALPPLTDEEKYDVSQLMVEDEPTEFFHNVIAVLFQEHSVSDDNGNYVMKAPQVAAWMTKSLGVHVSAHDKRVLSTLSRFSAYGTGYLTADNFEVLYIASLKAAADGSHVKIGRQVGIKGQPTIDSIWKDIRNHNILSPVEAEREMKLLEMKRKAGDNQYDEKSFVTNSGTDMMDECEILNDGQHYATTTSQTPWDFVKENAKSSHELVDMAADGSTPLYLRDGDFIFIDEESCIGCTQCAQSAPASFLMLDNGRARAFVQRHEDVVSAAVATCPVSCMHRVSYDELVELETAREQGDGRTDHRHVGVCKPHTPLHIARRGTDAGHKSSWYHHLKQKCYLSKDCPKRGCYACPNYSSPGENPYWKLKHKNAEHIRASTFVASGAANKFRKFVDL